jgi:hypothetical protein
MLKRNFCPASAAFVCYILSFLLVFTINHRPERVNPLAVTLKGAWDLLDLVFGPVLGVVGVGVLT